MKKVPKGPTTTMQLVMILIFASIALGRGALGAPKPEHKEVQRWARTTNEEDWNYVENVAYMMGYMTAWAIGSLVMGTIVSMFYYLGLAEQEPNDKRGFSDMSLFNMNTTMIWSRIGQIQETWQNFDVNNSDCRMRFICEAYVAEPNLGFITKTVMKLTDYALKAGMYIFPDTTQKMFEEYDKSKRAGKEYRNCTSFDGCSHSFVPSALLGMIDEHSDAPQDGDLANKDGEFGSGVGDIIYEGEGSGGTPSYQLQDLDTELT